MGSLDKLYRLRRLRAHHMPTNGAEDPAQQGKNRQPEGDSLYTAITAFPSLGMVSPPPTLGGQEGVAPTEQSDEDEGPREGQQEDSDNNLIRIWEEEGEARHGSPAMRDLVSDVEEVEVRHLRDELVSFSRELAPAALIVDDEPNLRTLLAAALANHGWRTAVADGGEAALAELRSQRFDLVFLDLSMPRMNGAQVFREIRKVAPTTNVVIITAYPYSDLMREAFQVGPFAVMQKPFRLEELKLVLALRP